MAHQKSTKQATTEQDIAPIKLKRRSSSAGFQPGVAANPTGKGGFGDNPQNINPGGRPKNQDSITAQYRIMLNMTQAEIDDLLKRKDELTMAQRIALARIRDAMRSGDGKWLANAAEITDRTEGKAKQVIDAKFNRPPVALVSFMETNKCNQQSKSK